MALDFAGLSALVLSLGYAGLFVAALAFDVAGRWVLGLVFVVGERVLALFLTWSFFHDQMLATG